MGVSGLRPGRGGEATAATVVQRPQEELVVPSAVSVEIDYIQSAFCRNGLWGAGFKRMFDIVVAAALLVVLSPVLVLLSAAVAIHFRGNPFFAHRRMTRHGETFRCLKFRTMRHLPHGEGEEEDEARSDYKNGTKTRTTSFTSLLRRTSLDELPQLINVLAGDMSIVGPRPIVSAELARHFGQTSGILLSVRPGMTGLWTVSGRSSVTYPERTQIELRYVTRLSLWQDLRILLQTVRAVLGGKGAL
jgi:lipopolysaccharide/colanic/teichoic acid biosynthesis glycosyltransferase